MKIILIIPLLVLAACESKIFARDLTYEYSAKKVKGIRHAGVLKADADQDLKQLKRAFDKESKIKCGKNVYLLDGMKEQSYVTHSKDGDRIVSYQLKGDFSCKPVSSFK